MDQWSNEESNKLARKTYSIGAKNFALSRPGLNPDYRGEMPASNRLDYGKAVLCSHIPSNFVLLS
jgi:hypothetical protein